jgi:hypothetical protein
MDEDEDEDEEGTVVGLLGEEEPRGEIFFCPSFCPGGGGKYITLCCRCCCCCGRSLLGWLDVEGLGLGLGACTGGSDGGGGMCMLSLFRL